MKTFLFALTLPALLLADFRYETTTRITKGMILKIPFAKKPEPTTTVHYMKAGRMATVTQQDRMVIDFDKQLMTHINAEKKQYWQVSFDEMKAMMTELQQESLAATQGKSVSAEMSFDAKSTGVEKEVGGFPARQVIMTMEMVAKDPQKASPAGAMKMVSDSWHSEGVPGYGEYKKFYERLKDKGGWMNLGQMKNPALAQQGMSEGMRKMAEEMQKTPGIAVLTISRVYMPGMAGMPDMSQLSGNGGATGADAGPGVGDALKQAGGSAGGQTIGQQIGGPLGGMMGGALGGKLGGFGGFGKKKKESADKAAEAERAQAQTEQAKKDAEASAAAKSADNKLTPDNGLMMESLTDASGFSTDTVSEQVFAIPAGFTKIEPDLVKKRKK